MRFIEVSSSVCGDAFFTFKHGLAVKKTAVELSLSAKHINASLRGFKMGS